LYDALIFQFVSISPVGINIHVSVHDYGYFVFPNPKQFTLMCTKQNLPSSLYTCKNNSFLSIHVPYYLHPNDM